MRDLNLTEEMILLAVWKLEGNAYGVSIRDKIHELTGKLYTYGTLYKILEQIVQRGYVLKIEGEPTNERGGRRKLYYKLTVRGIEALKNSYSIQQSLWLDINWQTLNGLDIK